MATATTSYTSNTCPRITLSVSEKSKTGNSVTYSYTLKYVTNGYTMNTSNTKTVTASIGGTSVYNAAITVGGKTTYTIKKGTLTKSKTHSAQTISINVSIEWGSATWSGVSLGTRSGSASMTLATKTSYTVAYGANGGSGTPGKQTKWYGETLTLSSTKPKRTGYTFSKWNTAAGGSGTSYLSGASYTANASATLHAQWTANKYTITLNANGGSGGTTSVTKTYGSSVTLPTAANSPKRTNYKFLGWAATSTAKSAQWAAGAKYSNNITSNKTLYAVWELAYIAPSITGFSVYRCDSTGSQSDDGTYAKVSFSWKIDTSVYSSNAMKSVTVAFNGASKYSSTAGGTSGTVNKVVSGISTETTYSVVASVADTYASGTTTTKTGKVESASYTLDFASGGKGIGIGTVAPTNGLKIAMRTTVHDNDCGIRHAHSTSGVTVSFGVGSGGKNHGIYSTTNKKWIVHADSDSGKVYVNGYECGVNHVLWSGAYYMQADQTVTLSEAVTDQTNGISLVFSLYSDNTAKNQEFFTHFIPKSFCELQNGKGISIQLCSAWGNAVKYLYINNTSIGGHANNNVTSLTVGGITYNNKRFVLRYVIGV